jgi:hypothetical protein
MTVTAGSRLEAGSRTSSVRWAGLRIPRHPAPGWPLAAYFVGYPLWWVLGVTQVACVVLAGVMAFELARRRRVLVPLGFGIWMLFLVVTLAGPVVAQVVAPGTTPGFALNHYFGWAYRLSMLVTATVALVYVTTLKLSAERVGRILSCMFVTIVAGGLLGVVAPHLNVPSLVELLLPRHLDANPFIHAEVHPTPAEVQDYIGDVRARPSAPFSYSNEWGLNFAVFLPFFVLTWFARDAGWRRVAAPFVLLVAVIPVVVSLNRGLWVALIVSAMFLAGRAAFRGHFRMLGLLLVTAIVVPAFILLTPLKGVIEARFASHNSNEGRTNLQTLAVTDTADTSPLVGFGSTRRLQGSFHSISEGATTQCPRCAPPAVGTQGRLWTVIFLFGFAGMVLFLGFFLLTFLRHIRSRAPSADACLTVMLASLVTLPVYDFSFPAGIAVMCAISRLAFEDGRKPLVVPLARYRSFARANTGRLVNATLLGALVGGVVAVGAGTSYHATSALAIPPAAASLNGSATPPSLDDAAQIAEGGEVTARVAQTLGVSEGTVSDALSVGAVANSRILLLTYTANTRAEAVSGAVSTSTALLQERRTSLATQRSRLVVGLTAQAQRLSDLLRRIAARHGLALAPVAATDPASADNPQVLLPEVQDREISAASTPLDPGAVIGTVTVRHDVDRWWVDVTSGAVLGLLLGVVVLWWGQPRWVRVGYAARAGSLLGTPVLGTVDRTRRTDGDLDPRLASSLARLARHDRGVAFVAADTRPASTRLSRDLSEAHPGPSAAHTTPGGRQRVVLVASTRGRLSRTSETVIRLRHTLMDVSGVVLVRERSHALAPARKPAAQTARSFTPLKRR